MTQEFKSKLTEFIPESDTVKMVCATLQGQDIDSWDKAITIKAQKALAGSQEDLLDLLEMTKLNAHNEGMLDMIDPTEQSWI